MKNPDDKPQNKSTVNASVYGPYGDLAGLRYVNLLRCSNVSQVDTSPEGQKHINDIFGKLHGMVWVADVSAEGVSGSQTFNRQDIKELVEFQKKQVALSGVHVPPVPHLPPQSATEAA